MKISLPTRWRHVAAATALAAAAATGLSACGNDANASGSGGDGTQLRLGYFPNLTHGTALVGIEKGYYEDQLSEDGASVQFAEFDSGSDTITALLNGDLAATYIGPVPALTAYSESENVTVIAGAASGGAALVVNDDIQSIDDLEGKTIATPGEFNTQDIAARAYLSEQGFEINPDGSGDVNITPQDNSVIVQAFRQGDIDGAWVPEPYASIMVNDGGNVLVDESELWPEGQFVTTHLLVNNDFLEENPDLVEDLLAAHVEANDYINGNPDEAKQLISDKLVELTGAELPDEVLESAWSHLTFTNDPIASSLEKDAADSYDVGALEEPIDDVSVLYDLAPLNKILEANGEEAVPVP
ncbi:MAG TPA: ABC transporter substrate-binding protein [Nocardioidaceae bacterium]|nr:ABC transporter substrate-binding protein [Nocardioidaceae bacterium]